MGQGDDTLVLYVLGQIKEVIRQLDASAVMSSSLTISVSPSRNADLQRRHALILTFVSALSALPLRILAPNLEDTKALITSVGSGHSYESTDADLSIPGAETEVTLQPREELVRDLFEVLFDQVGYAEKEYVKDWWYAHRDELLGQVRDPVDGKVEDDGSDTNSMNETRPRM